MEQINGVRYVRFKDEEIFKLLTEKKELIMKLRSMQEDINKIVAEGEVLQGKVQKVKDKSIPMLEEKANEIELGEWEIVTQFQVDGDEIVAEVLDQVEAEKDRIRDAKKAKEEKEKKTEEVNG